MIFLLMGTLLNWLLKDSNKLYRSIPQSNYTYFNLCCLL